MTQEDYQVIRMLGLLAVLFIVWLATRDRGNRTPKKKQVTFKMQ